MRKQLTCSVIVGLLLGGFFALAARDRTEAAVNEGLMLAHNVYFSLKDNSAEAKKKTVDACRKYLSKHPDEVFFAAGTLAEELNRPVNDREFDVALHIVFKDKEAHDKYQEDQRHKDFIEENK